MNEEQYSQITDALVDTGYIVIENALDKELIDNLYTLSQNETQYKQAGISNTKNSHVDSTKRSDKTQWLDEDAGVTSKYLSFSDGLREYLNHSLYLGLTYYEAHFAIYDVGGFYEKHLDAFVGDENRVVTTLFYLNAQWSQSDEGEMIMYDMNDRELERITPRGGTLVVFLSDKFPHEVLVTKKKRHSIAGWFRADRR